MATIDYKEKYEQALERARQFSEKPYLEDSAEIVGYIFPELRESEDERIRKHLIAVVELYYGNTDEQEKKDCLAWLEKQGEQNPTDKIEPKFKVGDWVVNKFGNIKHIVRIENDCYYAEDIGGVEWYGTVEYGNTHFYLWTIKDAKDGDVLMSRAPFIYGRTIPYGGLDWYNGKFIKASNYVFKDSPVHPATKKQRATLEKAMADAGYAFDFEKKELKKIEQKPVIETKSAEDSDTYNKIVDECFGEQKPNYCHHEVDLSDCSEEYRKAYYDGWNNCNIQYSQCKSELDDVVKCLINGMKFYYEDNEEATWGTDKWSMPVKHIIEVLEKQAQKPDDKSKIKPIFKTGDRVIGVVSGMPYFITKVCDDYYNTESGCTIMFCAQENFELYKQKPWSEKDEEMLDSIIEEVRYIGDFPDYPTKEENELYDECLAKVDWLKSIKDRVLPQQKQEWSEEDDRMYNRIVSFIPQHLTAESYTACINWLKSLRPQNTWKPSEEQMKALYDSIPEDVKEISEREMLLNELYKDLRKEYYGR